MEDVFIGIGTLLAILGPLLFIPITWMIYRVVRALLARTGRVSGRPLRLCALSIAVILVGGSVLLSYVPGRLESERLCRINGDPVITDSAFVDGFYRTKLFPYEADQYLREGFTFVEAPSPYAKDELLRYERGADGSLNQVTIQHPSSTYGVDVHFETVRSGLHITSKRIYEMSSNRPLGTAYNIVYDGGPLSLLLGAYGLSSCPDPGTPTGSETFQTYYDFEKLLLIVSDKDA